MNLDAGEEILVVICFIALCFCIDSIFEKYFEHKVRIAKAESETYEVELDDDDKEGIK